MLKRTNIVWVIVVIAILITAVAMVSTAAAQNAATKSKEEVGRQGTDAIKVACRPLPGPMIRFDRAATPRSISGFPANIRGVANPLASGLEAGCRPKSAAALRRPSGDARRPGGKTNEAGRIVRGLAPTRRQARKRRE